LNFPWTETDRKLPKKSPAERDKDLNQRGNYWVMEVKRMDKSATLRALRATRC